MLSKKTRSSSPPVLPMYEEDTIKLTRRRAGGLFDEEPTDVFLRDGKEVMIIPVDSGYVKKDKRVFFSYINTTKGLVLLTFLMNLIFYAAVIIAAIVVWTQGPSEVEHWAQKKFAGMMSTGLNYVNGGVTQVCGVINTKLQELQLGLTPIDCAELRLFNITGEISQSAAASAMQSTDELYISSFYSVIDELRSSANNNLPPSHSSSSSGPDTPSTSHST